MRLWIPGPTEVRPELLAELAHPMIGHRAPEMGALIERLDPHLHHAFGLDEGTTSTVAVHTTSATGMMEAALRGVGPRVLCLICGAFGRRWFKIAQALGKDAHSLEVPMGEAPLLRDAFEEEAVSDGGALSPPSGPGWGLTPRAELVERFTRPV